jgi:diaminobutyrate-2-oxoglutarate transaminase
MNKIVRRYGPDSLFIKGRGMMIGISCPDGDSAAAICRHAFEHGLVIETSGAHSEVVKCLCPLIISEAQIDKAMTILDAAFAAVMTEQTVNQASQAS